MANLKVIIKFNRVNDNIKEVSTTKSYLYMKQEILYNVYGDICSDMYETLICSNIQFNDLSYVWQEPSNEVLWCTIQINNNDYMKIYIKSIYNIN